MLALVFCFICCSFPLDSQPSLSTLLFYQPSYALTVHSVALFSCSMLFNIFGDCFQWLNLILPIKSCIFLLIPAQESNSYIQRLKLIIAPYLIPNISVLFCNNGAKFSPPQCKIFIFLINLPHTTAAATYFILCSFPFPTLCSSWRRTVDLYTLQFFLPK